MARRTAVLAVAVVVGAAAVVVLRVSGEGGDDREGELRAAEVEPAEVGFDTTTPRGGLRYELLAVGDVLVSAAEPDGGPPSVDELPSEVVYSTDLGATWAVTELPGLPPNEGEDDDDDPRTFVVRSDDEGGTWEEADCPSPGPPLQRAGGCSARYPGGLLVSPQNRFVSLDDGRTWDELDLADVDLDEVEELDVVQRSDDGWLALAAEREGEAEYSGLHRHLLRSEDGIRWERVFDHDTRCNDSFHGEWFSTPVPLGRRWLVAHTCRNPIDHQVDDPIDYQPRFVSQLLVMSTDGSSIRPIAGTVESKYAYTQPIVAGDTVVVPLRRNGVPFTNLRTVTPP